MAATRCDVLLYVLKHDMPALHGDPLKRTGASCRPPGISSIRSRGPARRRTLTGQHESPIALDGTPAVQTAADIVVVHSHYSSLQQVTTHLRRQGYDVVNVAEDDWEAVPSLLPYIRGADCVVCSGYSTIMDAAVAGTPCVIHPATDEQAAVADWIQRSICPASPSRRRRLTCLMPLRPRPMRWRFPTARPSSPGVCSRTSAIPTVQACQVHLGRDADPRRHRLGPPAASGPGAACG